jgi:hypothetical protein
MHNLDRPSEFKTQRSATAAEEDGPGVPHQQNSRTWKEFRDLINSSWRKGAEGIIETGRYLCEAKEELEKDEFEALVRLRLTFDASTGRKLMLIARHKILCAHVHKLPPCWGTIYELTKLKDEVLLARIEDSSIHPGMKRKDAKPRKKTSESPEPVSRNVTEKTVLAWLEEKATAKQKQRVGERILTDIDEASIRKILKALPQPLMEELADRLISLQTTQPLTGAPFCTRMTKLLRVVLGSDNTDVQTTTLVTMRKAFVSSGLKPNELVVTTYATTKKKPKNKGA